MCRGIVDLASVPQNGRFVNITGRKIQKPTHKIQSRFDKIFQSRILTILRESSRDISSSHKVQSRLSSSFNILIHRDYQNLVESATYVLISTHTLHLVEIHAIICTYTSRYIMHKRVYTVTLDIECWDDLKVEKIDWAKSINLFPDEFIHSSVQEHRLPRLVDRT